MTAATAAAAPSQARGATDTPLIESTIGDFFAAMAARQPSVVVPGHMAANDALDVSAIHYTRDYLLAFEQELASAANSEALIAAMNRRYPNAGLAAALQIGAKVAKGEMKWG